MKLRAGRWLWLWLLVFLFPLSLVAGRFCWFGPTDDAYHSLLALHRVLPQIVIVAALVSVATVIFRISLVRNRLDILTALASDPPAPLLNAFVLEAARLRMSLPQIIYITATAPICFTAFGFGRARVFASRGFAQDLDDAELRLVAHHELVHIRDRHATWNFFWHVVFAALVLPGFNGLERVLRLRRELHANLSASKLNPPLYQRLLRRRARERQSLCSEGQAELPPTRFGIVVAPLAVVSLFVALGISHADFMRDLPYLATHHC